VDERGGSRLPSNPIHLSVNHRERPSASLSLSATHLSLSQFESSSRTGRGGVECKRIMKTTTPSQATIDEDLEQNRNGSWPHFHTTLHCNSCIYINICPIFSSCMLASIDRPFSIYSLSHLLLMHPCVNRSRLIAQFLSTPCPIFSSYMLPSFPFYVSFYGLKFAP
jgi:hypothetical protein